MAVYVDDMKARFGRMIMCHMIADTTEELLTMARKIGVQIKWLQKSGTAQEHFDICMSMRDKAIANGAISISWRQTAAMCKHREAHGSLCAYSIAEDWLLSHFKLKV